MTDPKAMKIKIVGDILSLDRPVSIFKSEFEPTLPFSVSSCLVGISDSKWEPSDTLPWLGQQKDRRRSRW